MTALAPINIKDHRQLGIEQELFYFNELTPGCCHFLPHGTRIYRELRKHLQDEYWERGFDEVITPQIAKKELWEISGHWDKYKDDMYTLSKTSDEPGEEYALKAMNCPMHCLLFASKARSYRDLPLRLADFGMLHRNECSGSLTGLTRTRCFQQDDAHIFCRSAQIIGEIQDTIELASDNALKIVLVG